MLYEIVLQGQVVIEAIIDKDPVAKFLSEKSLLTQAQLDSILIHRFATTRGLKMKEMASMRDVGRVSKGSFLRTLRQGEKNMAACIHTIILGIYLDVIQPETASALVNISEMVSRLKGVSVADEEVSIILKSLQELAKSMTKRVGRENL